MGQHELAEELKVDPYELTQWLYTALPEARPAIPGLWRFTQEQADKVRAMPLPEALQRVNWFKADSAFFKRIAKKLRPTGSQVRINRKWDVDDLMLRFQRQGWNVVLTDRRDGWTLTRIQSLP